MPTLLQVMAPLPHEGARATVALVRETRDDARSLAVAALLLLVLAVFLSIHLLALAGPRLGSENLSALRDSEWMLTREGSWSERFEYLLLCGSALAIFACALRWRSMLFAVLAAAHLWLAADNALTLHERAGGLLPAATHVGEMLFMLLVAGVLGATTLVWLRRSPPALRALAVPSLACLAGVGVFAIGIDAVHALGNWGWWPDRILGFVEDGGEAVFITLGAIVSLALFRRARAAENPEARGLRPATAEARP